MIPLLIAHRGDHQNYPENTLPAFLSAIDKGADGIEFDIHFDNGELVVVHNFIYDKSIRHPRIEDVLHMPNLTGRVEIEIKAFDTRILSPLQLVLEKYLHLDIELTTSEIPLSYHMSQLSPKYKIGLIFNPSLFQDWMTEDIVTKKIVGWSKMAGASTPHVPLSTLAQFGKEKLVKQIHDSGLFVHTHLPQSDSISQDFDDISRWGVDQCTVDDISLIRKVKRM